MIKLIEVFGVRSINEKTNDTSYFKQREGDHVQAATHLCALIWIFFFVCALHPEP